MSNKQLNQELRQAGAEQAETADLLKLASQLQQLSPDKPRQRWLSFRVVGLVAVPVMMAAVIYAQASLPGSWSYPVKRLSEQTVVAIDPSYQATIMMRRSVEVKQLIAQHATSQAVLTTLADYRTQALLYESQTNVNYQAFEYCKTNLQQAAKAATTGERSAITTTLASLQT